MHRSAVIDVVGALRVEIAQRIVGQCGQVYYGIIALEVPYLHIANVFAQGRNRRGILTQCAIFKKESINADHLVPRGAKHGNHDRPDITVMTADQYFHSSSSVRIMLGPSYSCSSTILRA